MSAKKSETKVSAFETDTSRLIHGDDDDAHCDSSRSVWGKRDPGCLGGYNDVVSRLPSFQIFMFVAISAATMTVLWGDDEHAGGEEGAHERVHRKRGGGDDAEPR